MALILMANATRGWYALHHSLMRANGLPFIELLLDHGADPMLLKNGFNAVSLAACEGRADVLQLLAHEVWTPPWMAL